MTALGYSQYHLVVLTLSKLTARVVVTVSN